MLKEEVAAKRKLVEQAAFELAELGVLSVDEANEVSTFANGLSREDVLAIIRALRDPPYVDRWNIRKESNAKTLERLTRDKKITCEQLGKVLVFFEYTHTISEAISLVVERIEDPENHEKIFSEVSASSSTRMEVKAMLSVFFGKSILEKRGSLVEKSDDVNVIAVRKEDPFSIVGKEVFVFATGFAAGVVICFTFFM